MIAIELGSDDFDRNGLAKLCNAVDAVLKAAGKVKGAIRPSARWHPPLSLDTQERWPILAQREIWNKVDAGVARGILRPVDTETHAYRSRGDCADAVIPFAELVKWGAAIGLYDFRRAPDTVGSGDGAAKVGAGGTAPRESKQAVTITTNRLKTRIHPLDAVILLATKTALAPDDHQSVWAELVKLAESESRPAPLAGYSSDGIQYRGKLYEEKGEFDIYTKKNLRDKMARDKAR